MDGEGEARDGDDPPQRRLRRAAHHPRAKPPPTNRPTARGSAADQATELKAMNPMAATAFAHPRTTLRSAFPRGRPSPVVSRYSARSITPAPAPK